MGALEAFSQRATSVAFAAVVGAELELREFEQSPRIVRREPHGRREMLLRTADIFFREGNVGSGGVIASVVLLRGRDLRESLGGNRQLLEAECAFDERDAIGRRVRIERDDAASPIDCFRAVLSLRDGRKRAAGVRAP